MRMGRLTSFLLLICAVSVAFAAGGTSFDARWAYVDTENRLTVHLTRMPEEVDDGTLRVTLVGSSFNVKSVCQLKIGDGEFKVLVADPLRPSTVAEFFFASVKYTEDDISILECTYVVADASYTETTVSLSQYTDTDPVTLPIAQQSWMTASGKHIENKEGKINVQFQFHVFQSKDPSVDHHYINNETLIVTTDDSVFTILPFCELSRANHDIIATLDRQSSTRTSLHFSIPFLHVREDSEFWYIMCRGVFSTFPVSGPVQVGVQLSAQYGQAQMPLVLPDFVVEPEVSIDYSRSDTLTTLTVAHYEVAGVLLHGDLYLYLDNYPIRSVEACYFDVPGDAEEVVVTPSREGLQFVVKEKTAPIVCRVMLGASSDTAREATLSVTDGQRDDPDSEPIASVRVPVPVVTNWQLNVDVTATATALTVNFTRSTFTVRKGMTFELFVGAGAELAPDTYKSCSFDPRTHMLSITASSLQAYTCAFARFASVRIPANTVRGRLTDAAGLELLTVDPVNTIPYAHAKLTFGFTMHILRGMNTCGAKSTASFTYSVDGEVLPGDYVDVANLPTFPLSCSFIINPAPVRMHHSGRKAHRIVTQPHRRSGSLSVVRPLRIYGSRLPILQGKGSEHSVVCSIVRVRACGPEGVPAGSVAVAAYDRAGVTFTDTLELATPALVPSAPFTIVHDGPQSVSVRTAMSLNLTLSGPLKPNSMVSFELPPQFAAEIRDRGECSTTAAGAILRIQSYVLMLALPGDYDPTPALNPDANAQVVTEKLDCSLYSGVSVYSPETQPVDVVLNDLVNGRYELRAVTTVVGMPTVVGLRLPVVALSMSAALQKNYLTSKHLAAVKKVLQSEIMDRCYAQGHNEMFVHEHELDTDLLTVKATFAMYCSQQPDLLELALSRMETVPHLIADALPDVILSVYSPALLPVDTVTSNVLNGLLDVDESDVDCGANTIRKCSPRQRCTTNEDCDNNLCDVYAELNTRHDAAAGDLPLYEFGVCMPNVAARSIATVTAVFITLVALMAV